MRWAILVFLLAAGCEETFEDPPKLDLYKDPYDFATGREPRDQGVGDLGDQPDLRMTNHPDLLSTPDLLTLPDLKTEPDQN